MGTYNSDEVEVVLDIAQAIGIAPGLSQVRMYFAPDAWTNPNSSPNQPVNSNDALIYDTMVSENVCKQLSQSWLWEPEDVHSNDGIFGEMAAQGQSFFTASGDHGAFDGSVYPYFYPAEDDYVTAVGGTDLTTTGPGGTWVNESAWTDSSGGISPDGIPIQNWQTGVANSLNGGSTSLRNVPDVAMEANTDNYYCTMNVCYPNPTYPYGAGGTSYAAPRWAGFMALVNQQAVAAGNSTVGFINPLIYTIGLSSNYTSDFHDITSGNNDCCSQPVWFKAVPDYDLVTGWGSPNGQNLIDALAGSPPPNPWEISVNNSGGGGCYDSNGTVTITLTQQTNGNSLNWSSELSISPFFNSNFSWILSDSNGSIANGSLSSNSTSYSGPNVVYGPYNFSASRAPIGTPSITVSGYYLDLLNGCDRQYSGSGVGIQY